MFKSTRRISYQNTKEIYTQENGVSLHSLRNSSVFFQLLSNVVAVDQKGNYPTKNRNKIQVDRKAVLSAVILVSATHENLPIACGYTRAVKPSAEQG